MASAAAPAFAADVSVHIAKFVCTKCCLQLIIVGKALSRATDALAGDALWVAKRAPIELRGRRRDSLFIVGVAFL